MKRLIAMAIVNRACCNVCPLNARCKRFSNPKALGLCQEVAIWLLFAAAIILEIKVLF